MFSVSRNTPVPPQLLTTAWKLLKFIWVTLVYMLIHTEMCIFQDIEGVMFNELPWEYPLKIRIVISQHAVSDIGFMNHHKYPQSHWYIISPHYLESLALDGFQFKILLIMFGCVGFIPACINATLFGYNILPFISHIRIFIIVYVQGCRHTNILKVLRQRHVSINLVLQWIELDVTKVGNRKLTDLISTYRLNA